MFSDIAWLRDFFVYAFIAFLPLAALSPCCFATMLAFFAAAFRRRLFSAIFQLSFVSFHTPLITPSTLPLISSFFDAICRQAAARLLHFAFYHFHCRLLIYFVYDDVSPPMLSAIRCFSFAICRCAACRHDFSAGYRYAAITIAYAAFDSATGRRGIAAYVI